MRTDPCPRLSLGALRQFALTAFFENDPILGVMHVVNVRFIPTFKATEALHDRMLWFHDARGESLPTVLFELRAHQCYVRFGISEAKRCAVQRNNPFPRSDIIEHRFLLLLADRVDVRVDQQTIELVQPLLGQ